MYEIIYVDGWPAFRKPDGSIRPFIAGAEEDNVTGDNQKTPDLSNINPDDAIYRTFNGIVHVLREKGDPTNINDWIPLGSSSAPSLTTYNLPDLPGLIKASNGQYYVLDPSQTGGKRLATEEELYAAMAAYSARAGTGGGGGTSAAMALLPEQRALLEAQTAAQRASIAQTDIRIAQDAERLALERTNAAFNQSRMLYAEARDDKRLAMEASNALFAQQNSISNLQLSIVQMQQRRAELQSQLDWGAETLNTGVINDINRFNAQMGFSVEQANVAAQQRKQEQLQSLARDISESAKAPGDYGKLAALTLANSGWGQANTAIGRGEDLRTTESTAPLESQLRTRMAVQAQPDRPFTFTPITPTLATAPVLAPLDFSAIKIPQIQPAPAPVPAPSAGASGAGTINTSSAAGNYTTSGGSAGGSLQVVNGQPVFVSNSGQTFTTSDGGFTAAANGGMVSGAYISGERGPELNIPLGDKTIVLNQKQMKAAGIDLKKLMAGSKKPEQFAQGGVFDQGWGNVTDPDRTMAMNFLNDALAKARAGTPWQQGNLPSPVYASSPGFSPIVSQVLGSLTSMAQGVPTEYFQELAQRYRPAGVRESVTQRSA